MTFDFILASTYCYWQDYLNCVYKFCLKYVSARYTLYNLRHGYIAFIPRGHLRWYEGKIIPQLLKEFQVARVLRVPERSMKQAINNKTGL